MLLSLFLFLSSFSLCFVLWKERLLISLDQRKTVLLSSVSILHHTTIVWTSQLVQRKFIRGLHFRIKVLQWAWSCSIMEMIIKVLHIRGHKKVTMLRPRNLKWMIQLLCLLWCLMEEITKVLHMFQFNKEKLEYLLQML